MIPSGAEGGLSPRSQERFCDVAGGDLHLAANSPCAPENSAGCGLVGALPVGCGPVSVETASWGAIKGLYR